MRRRASRSDHGVRRGFAKAEARVRLRSLQERMRTLILPVLILTGVVAQGGQPPRPDAGHTPAAAPVFNRGPLRTEALVPLPLGAVLPKGLAATATPDPGRGPERAPRRDLAGCGQQQRLARRHRRELGAWSLLRRWPRAARLPAAGRSVDRQIAPLGGMDADAPGRGRPDRSAEEHRLVAEHGDAEGAHPVPGGHGRPPRHPADAAILRVPPGQGARASAARMGRLPVGRRARERALAVQPHR